MMSDDAQLLRRYSQSADQAAFTELVGRHIGLVYAAALRRARVDSILTLVFTFSRSGKSTFLSSSVTRTPIR